MSNSSFGGIIILIIGILAVGGIISAVLIIYDASQPVMEAGKEGDIETFGEEFSGFLYVVILVLFVTILGTVILAILKGGGGGGL